MAKWSWPFLIELKALWHRVIVSNYSPYPFKWSTVCKFETFKNSWKAISLGLPTFSNSLDYSVGNRSNTSFWEYYWLGDNPFCTLFPCLYHFYFLRLYPMACSLDVGFRRPLSDRKSFVMSSLLSLLGDIHLHSRSRNISFWSHNHSKGLSCSFSLILGSPPTRKSRNVKISKKVNFFAWHALHGRVNTMGCIQRHPSFLLGLQWGFLYCKLSENLDHIFGRCQFALSIWDFFLETYGVCLARNRDRPLMLVKVLFRLPFCDKGPVCWQLAC